MTPRLFIAIPTYNRLAIAEQCIPTVRDGMADGDALVVYDDGSQEKPWESPILDNTQGISFERCESMGIDAQRRKHILEFWRNRETHGCTHLYLTDSDAFHDPSWRTVALALQAEHDAPVCLYRTQTHADYHNNIYRNVPTENVIWQRFAPGVSYLLTLAHCEILAYHMPEKISWDWWVPSMLGYRMAISRVSYCDHIDSGGLHSPEKGIGPERATNPTPWLASKREEIINALNAQAGQKP
jgi:hypothetical protein